MPSLNTGSSRNPSKPGENPDGSCIPRENLEVSSFPECFATHTDDFGHGCDNLSNSSNQNRFNTNSEVSSQSKSNSSTKFEKEAEKCPFSHSGPSKNQPDKKTEICEFPYLGSRTLQNLKETERCDFPSFGPNTTQNEKEAESSEFPYFGPSTQNEKEAESSEFPYFGPSTQNEKEAESSEFPYFGPSTQNEKEAESCDFPYFGPSTLEEIKETERCEFPSFGPNTLRSSEKETEMCEFPYFGPNLKDGRQRKPHFAHTGLPEINIGQECVQANTRTLQSDKSDKQTEIEDENTDNSSVYLHAVDTSNQKYVPLSTNLWLKQKRRMLYFPMDFGELTIDGLVDTGALSSAIPESDLKKIRLLTPKSIIEEAGPPNFHIIVANGGVEQPIGQVLLQFEVGDLEFQERFIVMKKLTNPLIGLSFLQRNNTVLDTRQAVLNFPFFSMHLETTDQPTPDTQEPIILESNLCLKPNEITTIDAKTSKNHEYSITGILRPTEMYDGHDVVLVCPAITTLTNQSLQLTMNNTSSLPITIPKGTHVATFSIMSPNELKEVQPVNPTILNYLNAKNPKYSYEYVNELLKQPRNQDIEDHYWFPTPENPGDISKHTPIQTRILNEFYELERLEKLDPTQDEEQRQQFLKEFQLGRQYPHRRRARKSKRHSSRIQ